MKFFVGIATGVALAAAAAVYASRNPGTRQAFEGIEADLRAGDYDALQARLDPVLAEVRRQVERRFGPQSDWATGAGAGPDAGHAALVEADQAAVGEGADGAVDAGAVSVTPAVAPSIDSPAGPEPVAGMPVED